MSDHTLTFTVIIPVYNGELFIAKAIESCLQQTLLPNEIIVIDDASNDRTAEIILSTRSKLVLHRKNDQNRGASFCRNIGIRLATSSWILFLDADDIFHHRKIEILNSCLMANKNIKVLGHAYTVKNDYEFDANGFQDRNLLLLKRLSILQLLLSSWIVTPALAVAALNNSFFDENLKYTEDHDFILRTAEKYEVWYLNIPLCSLNRPSLTPGGLSSNKWKMRVGEMQMFINYCKRNNLYLLIPFFILFSLCKHIKNWLFLKMIIKSRMDKNAD